MPRLLFAFLLCLPAAPLAAETAAPALPPGVAPLAFAAGQVVIHGRDGRRHRLQVELAETAAQRARGLMYRRALPVDHGMLFVYPAAQRGNFWMLNTYLPLSIAFLDEAGVIRAIRDMAPCPHTSASACPQYGAGQPYRYALEVNQGYFRARGIGVGDRLLLPPAP